MGYPLFAYPPHHHADGLVIRQTPTVLPHEALVDGELRRPELELTRPAIHHAVDEVRPATRQSPTSVAQTGMLHEPLENRLGLPAHVRVTGDDDGVLGGMAVDEREQLLGLPGAGADVELGVPRV